MIRQPIRSLKYDTCVEIAARRGEEDCILWPHDRHMIVRRFSHSRRAYYVICALAHGEHERDKVSRCTRHALCVNPDHMHWCAPKLTDEDVFCIRVLLGRYSVGALSRAFGIGRTTVKSIRRGLTYDHVPSPPANFDLDYWRRVVMQEDALCRT